jgi:hypothetical protein
VSLGLVITLLVSLAAFAFFFFARAYPPGLALLMALAVGALAFFVERTAQRLRGLHAQQPRRDDRPGKPFGGGSP